MYLNNVLIIISDYKNIIRIYVYIFFEEDETGSAGWMIPPDGFDNRS